MSRIQLKAFEASRALAMSLPLIVIASADARSDTQTAAQTQGTRRLVSNCNDNGPGSLRNAVALARSDDIIDLQKLKCRRIVLTSGMISIQQMNLTFLGPGQDKLTIDGDHNGAVLHHQPVPGPSFVEGTLRIKGLSIANGRRVAQYLSTGGCIFSQGHLRLEYSKVHHCEAITADPEAGAIGGGIDALNTAYLLHSAVLWNAAFPGAHSSNGGIRGAQGLTLHHSRLCDNYSSGDIGGGSGTHLTLTYSTVSHNIAEGVIGGVGATVDTYISKSTISHNRADIGAGASSGTGSTRIFNSTFSHNVSNRDSSALGIDGRYGPASVFNSTIAFNRSKGPFFESCIGAVFALGEVNFQSTAVSGNTCNGRPQDVWGRPEFGDAIVGADNLIGASAIAVPPDTLDVDPRLLPLADNGGPTLTHALPIDSPAIASGNNVAGHLFDQRGKPFSRVNGTRADIGAFER